MFYKEADNPVTCLLTGQVPPIPCFNFLFSSFHDVPEAGLLTTGIVILTFLNVLSSSPNVVFFFCICISTQWLPTQLPIESRRDPYSLPFALSTCHSFHDPILLIYDTKIMIMPSVFLSIIGQLIAFLSSFERSPLITMKDPFLRPLHVRIILETPLPPLH